MKPIEALLPIALLGTGRAGDVPAAVRRVGGVAGAMLEAVALQSEAEPHTVLLRAAGVLGQCQRVGFPVAAPGAPPAAPDAPERPPLDDPAWLARIERVLTEGPAALQAAVFAALAARGYRLHAKLLPAALDLAVDAPALRDAIGTVLGARGRWLATQRARWVDALGAPAAPTEADWSHGRLPARVAFLRRERAKAPEAARERLTAELSQVGADERAELASCLSVGLTDTDEPLLDALLVDRATEVRRTAARLLVRLPESARSRAVVEALGALVQRNRKGAWTVEAPEAAHPRAKALGLEPRPKSDELGERAFWLHQLVRNAPLAFWTAHTAMTPAEVVAWAAKSDWSQSLLRGIHDALLAAPDATWTTALLDGWVGKVLGKDRAHVQALLPWSERERVWMRRLDVGGPSALLEVVHEIAGAVAPTARLGADLSARLAPMLARRLGTDDSEFDVHARDLLLTVCAALPASALAPLRAIRRADDLPYQLDETVDHVERLVDVRLSLPTLPPAAPPAPAVAPDGTRSP